MTRSDEKTYLQRETSHARRTAKAKRVNWLVSRASPNSVLVMGSDGPLVNALLKAGSSVWLVAKDEEEAETSRAATARLSSAMRDRLSIGANISEMANDQFASVVIPAVGRARSIARLAIDAADAAGTGGTVLISLAIGIDDDGFTTLTESHLSPGIESLPLSHLESTLIETQGEPIIDWLSAWTVSEPGSDFARYLQATTLLASESFAAVAATWETARSRFDQLRARREGELRTVRAELAEVRRELTRVRTGFTESQEESARQLDEERTAWSQVTKTRMAQLVDNDEPTPAAGLVCPVGYRRVVGGRVGVVGSLVSGGDGVGDALGVVEGLADDPGVDVFGLVRGVSLPDGVKVFDGGFDAGLVERLRTYGGVVDHPGLHTSVAERAEVLMGLAAAGVPVVAADVDDELVGLIGTEMAEVLSSAEVADLGDPEARDRLSVLLRRFGLDTGSQVSKWREIAGSLDLTVAPLPTVSVVLATNRPDYLEHALGQVKTQTYPEVALVLVLHGEGFTHTDSQLEELYGAPLVVVRAPSKYVYGAVLNQGVAASTGSLVAKMDDDDWYSPEHLWDLVRAMDYSGAALVGKAAEFVYLEELDITIRRMVEGSETYGNRNLGGGTFLIKRTTLDTIGGWRRLPRQVDQALLEDLETLAIPWYRTLGYGYMLHRRAEGHTWEADVDYFLEHSEMQWRGLSEHAALIDS